MGTFTISQSQPDKNLWIYVDGDGCVTDLNPYGAGTNYLCVDEIKDAFNDDTDYVYSSATDLLRDLYSTPTSSWSGLSGTINYIQVYARGKSYLYPHSPDGIYKIITTLDATGCSIYYKSDNLDLLTTYATFNKVWSLNPSTATNWEWSDLSDWQIGIECSSPTLTDYHVASTFRPNAAGDKTELIANDPTHPLAENWECVDDENPKKTTSNTVYNWDGDGGGAAKTDLYNIPNHTTESGTIISVSVFYRVIREQGTAGEACAYIKTGGTEFHETSHDVTNIWVTYSYTWTINPDTAVAWTWADIDALQIGVQLTNTTGWIHCTQVYAVVDYNAALNPEIRTTQCYARINYDSEVTCTLNKPQEISVDHDRNLKMLNFWSGNRVVFDESRNGKTLVAKGIETGTTACTKMECMRQLGLYGTDVTTDGIGGRLDNTFKIKSFGWKKVTDTPLTFEWILELEYSNLDE